MLLQRSAALDSRASPGSARSSAALLAWVWAVAIVYASLFPFAGWRWPAGLPQELLWLRWPRYFIGFDIVSNLLGYLPLGLLVALARLRQGAPAGWALLLATAVGAGLSYTMEVTQHLLAPRVPSLLDLVLNAAGALLGGVVAALLRWSGLLRWWSAVRERWLERGNGGAMALLLLWPAALLFPAPVPLGLGQVAEPLGQWLVDALADVPWAATLQLWLRQAVEAERPAQGALAQHLAILLGLAAPCLLAFAAARRGWRRVGLVLGACVVAGGATSLSTVLNFGPDHAFSWLTPSTLAAMALGAVLCCLAVRAGQRLAAGLALVALTGLVLLVNQAPNDPYFAQSLQGWEQGRFIRFHGVAQWMGWLWPYAAASWLLVRLAGPPGSGR